MKIYVTEIEWANMKKNPYFYETNPEALKIAPAVQTSLKESWINILRNDPDLYKDCPYAFGDLLDAKAAIRKLGPLAIE